MAPQGSDVRSTGALRLVPPLHVGSERLRRSQRRLTLAGAPYRPGELPVAVTVRLPANTVAWANTSAAAHRLPVELTLRASIDAARSVDFLAARTAPTQTAIMGLLDAAAAHRTATVTAEGKLMEYSRLLLRGESASVTRIHADGSVELLLPLELALAWRLDAARAGQQFDLWAVELLGSPPAEAIGWESAAASSGRSLSEWAYACALSSIVADSASPQSRAKPIGL
jgi:hypothetical protein